MYGIDGLYANGLYDLIVNGLDVQSINIHPCDVHGLHVLFVTSMKRMPISVCPIYVRKPADVNPESDITSLNVLGPESALNDLNFRNVLGLESAQ